MGAALTYLSFSPGVLDFYVFLGPAPETVTQQYQEVIGRPHMPPYWALGFHQCRYGYHNLDEVIDVVRSFAANKVIEEDDIVICPVIFSFFVAFQIPLDTAWVDIDYMDHVSNDCLVYVVHNNVISWLCHSVASIRTSLLGT